MRREAASAGFYYSPGWLKPYARLQLISIQDLIKGKQLAYPPSRRNVTFKKAPKVKRSDYVRNGSSQPDLYAGYVMESVDDPQFSDKQE